MKVKEHLSYSALASTALYPLFGEKTLLFFVSSILIDLDHYVDFVYYSRFQNWNIKDMFRFHGQISQWKHLPNIYALEAFHTIEFHFSILALAAYFRSTELYLVFWGLMFHMALDLIRLYSWRGISRRALSFFEYWIRAKNMRRSGIEPEHLFNNAYALMSSEKIKNN